MPDGKKRIARSARKRAAPKAKTQKKIPARVKQPEDFGYAIWLYRAKAAPGGFLIYTGCRRFTMAQAKDHWGRGARRPFHRFDSGERYSWNSRIRRARQWLNLLPKLRRRARSYGWGA